jgi:nucleotide-binding universal stress UspA family protein
MYERILLTLDGSPLAEQAIPHAVVHAKHFDAELILMKVLEPLAKSINLPQRAVRKAEEETRKIVSEYLERLAVDIRKNGISVRIVMVTGSPHAEIAQFAERENIDLIVICTRGQSGLSRWLMGSVADRVARGVSVPVLLVRARKEENS